EQPVDSLTASLSELANNIPSLSKRSTLTSSEIANPYHVGYYNQIRQRTVDLMGAQYSLDPAAVKTFIETYGVDLWLVDVNAFKPDYIERSSWIRQIEPLATESIQTLRSGQKPVVERMMRECDVFRKQGRIVLDAQCILLELELIEKGSHIAAGGSRNDFPPEAGNKN
ncbi:MAG: hypothetical protein VKL39_08630, partial [Leptolyngbyaceae bacterium]|nr:hypothetical protein [Leptolyngbyaceae bacterium]